MRHKNEINILTHHFITLLLTQINTHDDSKLEEPEISLFSKNIEDFSNTNEYLSQDYNKLLQDINDAKEQHYVNNRHHPEHFENGVDNMTLIDVIDMLLDWLCSNVIYKNNIEEIEKMIRKQQKRFNLSDQLTKILINTSNEFTKL